MADGVFTFDVGAVAHRIELERKQSAPPSEDNPHYKKFRQDGPKSATALFAIEVDEGWRSWILATDMYDWAADAMLEILWDSNARWPH
jgi:hypothetical protein